MKRTETSPKVELPLSDTPRTDAAKHAYITEALPISNIFEPMALMERELAAERQRRVLAEATVTACHSAMLGKVNPKHPAWGCVFAVQDAAYKADQPKAPTLAMQSPASGSTHESERTTQSAE